MRSHCVQTLVRVLLAAAGSMIVVMLEHLRVQMFEVLQAPMHAFALQSDTSVCLASCCWQHDGCHAWASECADAPEVQGVTGTNACGRIAF
jgi:hypothetical protein